MYASYLKRVFDLIFSLIGLILLSPVFLTVTLLLFIVNHGKPFFLQSRPGMNEKIFFVIKFKTMNDKRDREGNLLSDAKRLTRLGRIIRKMSLDEVPQLLNVLKADMSLVGPRPLLVQYLLLYNEKQKRRHEVRPGITGWAQVNGRNAITWKQKFDFDIWYVEHMSFWLDLKILWKTAKKVFRSDGISSPNSATMEIFTGN